MNQYDKEYLERNKPKLLFSLGIAAVCLVILLSLKYYKNFEDASEAERLQTVLNDSMRVWTDKQGLFNAQVANFKTRETEHFTKLKTKDAKVIELQNLVESLKSKLKDGGSATIIHTVADIKVKEPSRVVGFDTIKDTVYARYTADIDVTGKMKINNKDSIVSWVTGRVDATRDSIGIDLKFNERIDVVLGEEPTGFLGLGKPKSFAQVTLHNPFNKVKSLKSYSKEPLPQKRWGVGPVGAYGVGYGFVPQFFVGAGINYSFIRF